MRNHFYLLPYPLPYHIQDGIFGFMAKQKAQTFQNKLAQSQVNLAAKPGKREKPSPGADSLYAGGLGFRDLTKSQQKKVSKKYEDTLMSFPGTYRVYDKAGDYGIMNEDITREDYNSNVSLGVSNLYADRLIKKSRTDAAGNSSPGGRKKVTPRE